MASDTDEDESEYKYLDKSTGKRYKYKLVWCENKKEDIWNVAYANEYIFTTSGVIIFKGAHGDIVISPYLNFAIK